MNNRKSIKTYILSIIDFFLIPFVWMAGWGLQWIRKRGLNKMPISRKILLRLHVCPIIDHYYEPLFDPRHLRYPLRRDRNLPGIDWNVDGQLSLLYSFHYERELLTIPEEDVFDEENPSYYYNNGAYEIGDGDFLYNMIRHFKPRQIVEVGSGFSTLAAVLAIRRNVEEDENYQCLHVCIEPYEKPWLERLTSKIIRKKLEDVDATIFRDLGKNDMLIIDSSHIIRPQGDVLLEYLEILPILSKGVLVHIHDIFSPKDYPDEWLFESIRFWNEQYLLEAFLTQNDEFEILAAVNYLKHNHFELLSEKCPMLKQQPKSEPGCFWIRRK